MSAVAVDARLLIFGLVAGALLAAFGLDRLLGDPTERSWAEQWYPPVLVGRAAIGLERGVPRGNPARETGWGTLDWFVLVAGVTALALGLTVVERWTLPATVAASPLLWALVGLAAFGFGVVWLKSTFAVRTLERFCLRPLGRPLDAMRIEVGQVVNRLTSDLPRELLCSALVESAVENTTDSVVAPLLAYSLLGLPGAVAYRTINTLDALWGHPEPRWRFFGRTAALVDSAVNYLPDHLASGMLRAVAGRPFAPPRIERVAPDAKVPATIRTAAGLLGVRLERRGSYVVGPENRPPTEEDVRRVVRWVRQASGLMLLLSLGLIAGLVDVGWTYFLR